MTKYFNSALQYNKIFKNTIKRKNKDFFKYRKYCRRSVLIMLNVHVILIYGPVYYEMASWVCFSNVVNQDMLTNQSTENAYHSSESDILQHSETG